MAKVLKDKVLELRSIPLNDALDNLSAISVYEVDPNHPLGIVKNHKIVVLNDDFTPEEQEIFAVDNVDQVIDILKLTYKTLYDYLKRGYEQDTFDYDDVKTRKGMQAIMVLVGDSANNFDKYLRLVRNQEHITSIADLDVYKKLQEFYVKKVSLKFSGELEGAKAWQRQYKESKKKNIDISDFETIRSDRAYELFYMYDDAEEPFFNASMLRNIKLFCDFDEAANSDFLEDPLLRISYMQDRDNQVSARQILKLVWPILVKFYKEKYYSTPNTITIAVNKAILALFLAANEKNLIQNTFGKSSIKYFYDFQNFLNKAINSDDYQKYISFPDNFKDAKTKTTIDLIQNLSRAFFVHPSGIKQEMIGYVYRLVRKGEEKKDRKEFLQIKNPTIWEVLLENDDSLRKLLKCFPNGPLFKILDIIRMQNREDLQFNPLMQSNNPSKIFELKIFKSKIDVLKLPSPTYQENVKRAYVSRFFLSFLKSLEKEKDSKHLLINFQDRNSWQEEARCKMLEEMSKRVEFEHNLTVITIAKNSNFYHQIENYYNLDNAKEFLNEFKNKFAGEINPNYFFPKILKTKEFLSFINSLIDTIYKTIFLKKETLEREKRLDFIEIFYQFLLLKIFEIVKPTSISFTCKDSVDISACENGIFYAFIKIIENKKLLEKDVEFLRFLFYSQSLLIRERALDSERFYRVITAISTFDNNFKKHATKILTEFSKLFEKDIFKSVKAIEDAS